MALVATIPRQRTALVLPHAVRQLIIEGAWRHGFALLGDLLSLLVQRRVSKETHPDIRVSLRSTSLTPVPLRGPAYKGHPWPFTPLAASMRLTPLHNTCARPADGEFARMQVSRFRPLGVVGLPSRTLTVSTLCVGMQPHMLRVGAIRSTQPTPTNSNAPARTSLACQKIGPGPGPVRRLSGIVV